MKRTLAPALLVLVPLLAGCGAGGDDVVVRDTGQEPGASASVSESPGGPGDPPPAPAADGPVRTRELATVMDTDRVELCLGPVAESYPPQCGGPEVVGWDWGRHGRDMFEQQGDVRWGTYAVTGRWDGSTFEVTEAVPAALYDAVSATPEPVPSPGRTYPDAELQQIAEEVGTGLPGAQGAYVAEGHVLVDVVHDDGSLQQWADEAYGQDVVLVRSLLVPAG